MARRMRSGGQDDGGYPRARRRGGRNEGIYIALAIAGVLGVVMAFVVSSGSSGDTQKAEAGEALRALFRTIIDDDEQAGKDLVDPRQIMSDLQKQRMKEWYELSDKERDEFSRQAWRLIRGNALGDLKLKDDGMVGVERYLSSATVEFVPSRGEVEFSWTYLGQPWRARLQKNDMDRWIVFDFRKVQ